MIKRCIGLLLAVILAVGALPTGAFAAEEQSENHEYALLSELGIIDSEQKSADILTRSTAARIAAVVKAGAELLYTPSIPEGYISDVTASTKNAAYIQFVIDNKLMSLTEDRKFEPDGYVSLDEMADIMARALGYENARSSGEKTRILKGVATENTSILKNADAFEMALNVLEIKPIGMNNKRADKDCLEYNFKVKKVNGVLSTSESKGDYGDAFVEVAGVKMYTSDVEQYTKYLGYRVEAYYEETSDDDMLVFVNTQRYDNKILRVYAADIVNANANTLTYRANGGGTRNAEISGAKLFYNRTECEFAASLLMPVSGTVTIIKPNTSYASAVVEEYEDYLLRSCYDEKLYDVNDPSYCLNLNDYTDYKIIIDGMAATPDELKPNDALCIFTSADRKIIRIEVSRKTVLGTIVSSDTESCIIRDEMGEEKYFPTRYFVANYEKTHGTSALFRLNIYGDIVAVDYASEWKYGYFMGKIYNDDGAQDETAYIRLLSETGEIKKFPMAKKIKVNGSLVKNFRADGNNALTRALKTMATSSRADGKNITMSEKNGFVCQIIKYKTDYDGNVSEILTAEIGDIEKDEKLVISEVNKQNMIYKGSGCFWCDNGATFFTPNETAIFYVPIASDNEVDAGGNLIGTLSDVKQYKAGDMSVLTDGMNCKVYSYDLTKSGRAGCMLVVNESGNATGEFKGKSSAIVAVKEVTKALNSDDEVVYKLTGWEGETEKSWLLASEFEFYKNPEGNEVIPAAGDLIQIYTDSNNTITQLLIRVDYSENALGYNYLATKRGTSVGSWWDEFGEDFGKIVAADEYGLRIETSATTTTETSYAKAQKLYVFNVDEKTFTKTDDISFVKTVDDFGSAEAYYAYVTCNYGRTGNVYIYVK